jgi:hypothetical protein
MGQQYEPPKSEAAYEDKNQCRKNSTYAPTIEIDKTKSFGVNFLKNNFRNQKSRYDKKDIDTNKSTGQKCGERVIHHDEQHSDRSQAINICSIVSSSNEY